ncbi:MAG TPA: hypothetical protein VFM18_00925, partial [Methanosarcina sp.]|nr:hypothetical protein [Methanosarcina sp.]
MSFKAFTDYPVFDGTDDGNHNIKEVLVLSYDGDKYATVLYNNFESEVKVGYLWKNKELNKRFNPKMFMALPDHPEGEVLSRQKLQNLVKKRRLGTQYSI